jgi:hypothetical protein
MADIRFIPLILGSNKDSGGYSGVRRLTLNKQVISNLNMGPVDAYVTLCHPSENGLCMPTLVISYCKTAPPPVPEC